MGGLVYFGVVLCCFRVVFVYVGWYCSGLGGKWIVSASLGW